MIYYYLGIYINEKIIFSYSYRLQLIYSKMVVREEWDTLCMEGIGHCPTPPKELSLLLSNSFVIG